MADFPTLDPLDRRLNIFSPNIAELSLRGKVEASQFLEGQPAQVSVSFTDLRANPDRSTGIDTQLLFGETVRVYDEQNGWLWVKNDHDSYVGWTEKEVINETIHPTTHVVCAPRTYFYPEPNLKAPHKGIRSIGSLLQIVGEDENKGTKYSILSTGEAIVTKHIRPKGKYTADYVSVAESLLGAPYLWAGATAFGLDCSGLVQLSFRMAGVDVLRDSDMQAATIGIPLKIGENYNKLQRGDLVFWRGHVGICQGDGMMIHANAHTMNVASEPLVAAIERIAYLYEKPIGFRRIDCSRI